VPWPDWRRTLETVVWSQPPVAAVAIGVAVAGLLLMLIGVLARRASVTLDGPAPEIIAVTTPRVLARLVGRRVRATDDIAAASVTASRRRVAVKAEAWSDAGPELRETVRARVEELLNDMPLRTRPRVIVSLQERRGPR
jgi:hypothetical protein